MGIAERKEREKGQRHAAIIDAAENVFFKKKDMNATMDDVAEEAELSKGTLYLYFKSKEDLLFAIFLRGSDILMQLMKEQLKKGKNGYEDLLGLAQAFIEFSRKYPDYFSLFIRFQSSELENLNLNKEQLEDYIKNKSPLALVNQSVEQGIQDGSLRNDLPVNELSTTLWTQMLGVIIVCHSKRTIHEMFGITMEKIFETHIKLVSEGGKRL